MAAPARTAGVVVVGGGIVGVAIATAIAARSAATRVIVLDKETALGRHASGRNSAVLHAGFYYPPGSLKAALCVAGNREMSEYCLRHGLPLRRCGKLVVAANEAEASALQELHRRAQANGAHEVRLVSEAEAARIEPLARTHGAALWSPNTAVGDALAVLQHQAAAMARQPNVEVRLGASVRSLRRRGEAVEVTVVTSDGTRVLEAGHVVNAAGLQADELAHQLGFGASYALLPFIGLYMYVHGLPLRRLIYPVPSLERPFLGVHYTVTVDGKVKIGPTAIPALFREQYLGDATGRAARREAVVGVPDVVVGEGYARDGAGDAPGFTMREVAARWRAGDTARILRLQGELALRWAPFRSLAWEEVRKYSRRWMQRGAAALLRGVEPRFGEYGRPGIRAQLVELPSAGRGPRLEMDFVVEGDAHSTHILNAVSPGWTTSAPFARHVVDKWVQRAL